jgi:LysM repeat protein
LIVPSAVKPSRPRAIAITLAAASWLVVCGGTVSRAQSEGAQPAATPGASSPATSTPWDAREQQFEILTQAVTALCQEIARNNARSEELTAEKTRLRAKVASLRRELSSSEDEDERLRNRAQALEKQLREVGAAVPEAPSERPRGSVASAETVPPTRSTPGQPGDGAVATGMPRSEAVGGDGTYHVVAPGDTLYRIGVQYRIDYRDLASANRILDPEHIEIGQRIFIPSANR